MSIQLAVLVERGGLRTASSEGFEPGGFGFDVDGVDVEVHAVLGRLRLGHLLEQELRPRSAVGEHVVSRVRPGDIVNLHDGLGRGTFSARGTFTEKLRVRRQVEVDALPGAIEQLLDRDVRFVTISDLVAAERPAPGEV